MDNEIIHIDNIDVKNYTSIGKILSKSKIRSIGILKKK